MKGKGARDQFWECLPAEFEVYKQATVANGDRIRAADHQGHIEEDTNRRDATFIRVSDCYPILPLDNDSLFPVVLIAQGCI